jgi:hypothetical protein
MIPQDVTIENLFHLELLTSVNFNYRTFGLDAAPYYSTLSASVSASGDFNADGIELDFNGISHTFDELERVWLIDKRDPVAVAVAFESETLNFPFDPNTNPPFPSSATADHGFVVDLTDREFFASIYPSLKVHETAAYKLLPFSPPWFGSQGGYNGSYGSYDSLFSVQKFATRTDFNQDPPMVTEQGFELKISSPFFRGSITGGDMQMYIRCHARGTDYEIAIDASSWGELEFRDIRGTYSGAFEDDDGISYSFSLTIG